MAASPSRSPSSSAPCTVAAALTFAGSSSSPRTAVAAPPTSTVLNAAGAVRTTAPPTSTTLLNAAAAARTAATSASFTPAAAPTLTLTTSSCTTETAQGMHLFNVNQYSLLKDLGVGKFVRSGTFDVGGHNWAVLFYPSGSEPAAGGGGQHHVSVYLELLTPLAVDVRVMFDLSLVDLRGRMCSLFAEDAAKGRRRYAVFSTSAAGGKLLPPHHHPPRCWGVSSFKRSELEASYIHDGGLTIRCDMSVIRPPHVSETRPLPPQIDVPPSSLPGDLGKLLEEKDGKDATVLVQGEAFPAHRAILAARSPVLKKKILALTSDDEPAPASSSSCTITMDDDMEPAVFKAMLHFIYTDTLPPDTEAEHRHDEFVRRLFVAAEACAVERLKRVCESIMCGNLSQVTLNTTMAFAEQHRCDELRAACVKFALASLQQTGKISSEFLKRLKRSADATNLEAHKRFKTN